MRLYRNLNERVQTDSKKPTEYISDWKEYGRIWLSGTKTEGAMRTTDLCLELEEADVLALFSGLVERYSDFWPAEETCGHVMSKDHRLAPLLGLCVEAMATLGTAFRKAVGEVRALEASQGEIRRLTLVVA